MTDYKYSSIGGFVGILIGIAAFSFNYYMLPMALPGYEILVAPAMLMLSFFSEETYFAPKMVLFLSGQFIGYFFAVYLFLKVRKQKQKNHNT